MMNPSNTELIYFGSKGQLKKLILGSLQVEGYSGRLMKRKANQTALSNIIMHPVMYSDTVC